MGRNWLRGREIGPGDSTSAVNADQGAKKTAILRGCAGVSLACQAGQIWRVAGRVASVRRRPIHPRQRPSGPEVSTLLRPVQLGKKGEDLRVFHGQVEMSHF